MGLILLFVFIGVPLIEIMLFIKIGGAIGMTMTVLVVIITALIGSYLLRAQGLATMRHAQASMDRAELPVESVIHGIFLLLAGAFLLTPGFFTDAVGFVLFVPSFRLALGRRILSAVMARGSVSMHASRSHWQSGQSRQAGRGGRPGGTAGGTIIDGEIIDVAGDVDSDGDDDGT